MQKKILVLGAGNVLRGDDAIGILAAQTLERELGSSQEAMVDIRILEEAHINILDFLEIYDKLIIVDAVTNEQARPGFIERIGLVGTKDHQAAYSSHQMGLSRILDMARKLDMKIPQEVVIFSMAIQSADFFTNELSQEVKKAFPRLVALLKDEIAS
jgi:hydrogenase maturation protease